MQPTRARRPNREREPRGSRSGGDVAGVAIVVLAAALRLWPTTRPTSNLFYDAAVRSMGLSWHNFFFGAIEPSGSVSVDKPPADLWLQVASTKVFGFTTFALHLPEAVGGAGAVGLLYLVVRSVWGRRPAALAALALAVLPISVVTSRSDTMDSVMVAVLVAALWASVRALETRRPGWILAAAGLVGVAFNVKLTQALIALPALGLMWCAAGGRRRVRVLLAAGATVVVVSMSWIAIASLTPPGQRPYPVGSGNGSIYRVVFIFNGLDRLRGASPQVGSSDPTAPGPLRLVGSAGGYGQLIGVELIAALALALALGLVERRARVREPPATGDADAGVSAGAAAGSELAQDGDGRVRRWTAVGLGVWLVTAVGLFSGMRQLQTRYLETASPAIAAVVGICAAGLLARCNRRDGRLGLGAAILVSSVYALLVEPDAVGRILAGVGVAVGLGTALWPATGGPGAGGSGPAGRRRDGVGVGVGVGVRVGVGAGIVVAMAVAVAVAVLGPALRNSVDAIGQGANDAPGGGSGAQYSAFLTSHRAGARYETASGDTLGAAGLIASDGQPVLILNDVKGLLVHLAQLKLLVGQGAVRYILLDHPCVTGVRCPSNVSWSIRHARRVRGYLYAFTTAGRPAATAASS